MRKNIEKKKIKNSVKQKEQLTSGLQTVQTEKKESILNRLRFSHTKIIHGFLMTKEVPSIYVPHEESTLQSNIF